MLFRVALSICIPTNTVRGFLFLHVLSSFYFFVEFLVVAVLPAVKGHLIVVLRSLDFCRFASV